HAASPAPSVLRVPSLHDALPIFFRGQLEGTDGRVRADEGALVAAHALGGIPLGDGDGGAALLISGSALLPLAVGVVGEGGDKQYVAVHAGDGLYQVVDLLSQLGTASQ